MSNKEPWLAVNLSKIFPGLGQLYSGSRFKGISTIVIYIALHIISFWFVFSPNGNFVIGAGVFVSTYIIWLWNMFDAYRSATHKNTEHFEITRKQGKDPWLAMFLSQLLFGIGHFYIGKWLFGILALILIIVFAAISQLLLPFLVSWIAYLAYTFSPIKREQSKTKAFLVTLLIVVSALLTTGSALLLRGYFVEARWIPSGSMEPTLHGTPNQWEADKIFVDKFSYRSQAPQFDDIVLFMPTEELKRQQYTEAFISRIIAQPGEKVQLKNGQVYINNKLLREEKYLSLGQTTSLDVCASENQPPYLHSSVVIPANSYLTLGDNRTQSYDGRCWGVVPRENIIGKAYKRFFPPNRVSSLLSK